MQNFRVAYLVRGRRVVEPEALDKTNAEIIRRSMKNQGLTAWVEDEKGTFVPVKGAMRKPLQVLEQAWIEGIRAVNETVAGEYESVASGQRIYVKNILPNGHVYFRLEPQGSDGNMSIIEFRKQYRPTFE